MAKSVPALGRTQKANTQARCGWNADRAQPFLVIGTRDVSSISDDRQKKADRFWSAPRKRTPRPDAAGMPIGPNDLLGWQRETRAAFQTTGRKSGQVLVRTQKANTPARRGWNADQTERVTGME